MRNVLLAIVLAVVLLVAVWQVQRLVRVEVDRSGWPEYSSLRADPLGTSILHDALQSLPSIEITRNTRDLSLLPIDPNTTLLLTGASPGPDPLPLVERLEKLASEGGRIVITLYPWRMFWEQEFEGEEGEGENEVKESNEEQADPSTNAEQEAEAEAEDAENDKTKVDEKGEEESEEKEDEFLADIEDRWGFGIEYEEFEGNEIEVSRAAEDTALPESLSFRSGMYFNNPSEEWRVIYGRGEKPVLISRAYGKGSIVLAADTYFLSNEALVKERHPALLLWLIGDKGRIVFDEWGKNISDDPRVIDLILRYRLHGFLLAFLILALLFVWQSNYRLAPRRGSADADEVSTYLIHQEAGVGLAQLLRNHLAPPAVLPAAVEEWRKSHRRHESDGRYQEASAALLALAQPIAGPPPTERDILDKYTRAQRLLKERFSTRD